ASGDRNAGIDAYDRTGRAGSTYSIADGGWIGGFPAVRATAALHHHLRVASSPGISAKLARHASGKRRFHEARAEQRRADDTGRRANTQHHRAKSKNSVARDCVSDRLD